MNNLQVFNFNQKDVRIIELDGEPWWVAKDVCDVLDILDTSQAIERLEEDEKLIRKLYVSGQDREIWIVNESGLYSLIIRSNKPEAKQFKRWITHDVLPTIRKHGKYETPKNDFEIILLGYEKLMSKVKELEPKGEAFDTFMSAKNSQPLGEVAKLFGIGRNIFIRMLREHELLMNNNVPYQMYMKYFEVIDKPVIIGDTVINKPVTLVRPNGIEYIMKKLDLKAS